MHKNVEQLIGRLATDAALLRRFAANPAGFLAELADGGFELSDVEREALAALSPEAIRAFAASLDARLRKAPLAAAATARPNPQSDTEEASS
jgi:hypothetical protein